MLKRKTQIIILGALSVTVLMNFQRMVIAAQGNDLSTALGLTMDVLFFRMLVMFGYACLLLNINLSWKGSGVPISSQKSKTFLFLVNLAIFIAGVFVATAFKFQLGANTYERRYLLAATLINYLIVTPILLLLARFINLTFQQQENLLEKEQVKQKALQHQLAAIRTQINPHFLFNSLDSLTALIRENSDRALAFVDQLSWLLRSSLQRNEEDFIRIEEELAYLESYIYLQKERFGSKFKVDIRIPDLWKEELIPSFSLQLLVENAIKHNIVSTQNPLVVEIYADEEFLLVRNRIQKRRDAVTSMGTGLANLSMRFKLLKKREVQILKEELHFTVKLPIRENESHFSRR
ncbi:MAG: histidine kinase [Bacteroidota bacterium]